MTNLKDLVKEYANDIIEAVQDEARVVDNGGHDDYGVSFESDLDIESILYKFASAVEKRT